ncbi:histidine kinase dimerization/phosphoacceptor domain -containing protein [Rhodospirillaceae bacterium SYSU D60014]|uniref:sensor histidine kinase n=1 Tax=Virgifigura deserti TaxID=2268457 RepID=UPI0013C442AC
MPNDTHDNLRRELEYRLRQQVLISELGLYALRNPDFDALLQEATRLTAEGLRTKFSKVLEFLPEEDQLLVRAGIGWAEGTVGAARISVDSKSPGGYALKTGRPVISNHLTKESRFRTPSLLAEHGVKRAINVIIPSGDSRPFGVLEVDSQIEGKFTEHDINFLQAMANVLGAALERCRVEATLETAVRDKDMLMREAHHRIKNSLSLVSSLINLQSRDIEEPKTRGYLVETSARVLMIARMHERLYQSSKADTVEFGGYLQELCHELLGTLGDEDTRPSLEIETAEIEIATEKAVSLALIVNELVTNAIKYARSGTDGGVVEVVSRRTGKDLLEVEVADNGVGLPNGFDPATSDGLGMKLVVALTSQLNGQLDIGRNARNGRGARFTLSVPL